MENTQSIRLTQTVQKGGCAAKVAALELRKILSKVRFPEPSKDLLIGSGTFDDAAIYRINSEQALVQTLDFFTPIVDTPRIFGRIAAANALSDVYAMGGTPLTAMAIFAFPIGTMEPEVAVEVLQGASDVISESRAAFVGGHTIDDDTMKFGLSVTGSVHPDKIWSNAGAKAEDILILTKPIGTGTLTAALKRGEVSESEIQEGLDSMGQLNQVLDLIPENLRSEIHAATDITGFGFAGHALNLARASSVTMEIELKEIPKFEKAMSFLEKGFLTKAHRTNGEYVKEHSEFLNSETLFQQLVFDPQTSGGLLLSLSADSADEILEKLKIRFKFARKVGVVRPAGGKTLKFQ